MSDENNESQQPYGSNPVTTGSLETNPLAVAAHAPAASPNALPVTVPPTPGFSPPFDGSRPHFFDPRLPLHSFSPPVSGTNAVSAVGNDTSSLHGYPDGSVVPSAALPSPGGRSSHSVADPTGSTFPAVGFSGSAYGTYGQSTPFTVHSIHGNPFIDTVPVYPPAVGFSGSSHGTHGQRTPFTVRSVHGNPFIDTVPAYAPAVPAFSPTLVSGGQDGSQHGARYPPQPGGLVRGPGPRPPRSSLSQHGILQHGPPQSAGAQHGSHYASQYDTQWDAQYGPQYGVSYRPQHGAPQHGGHSQLGGAQYGSQHDAQSLGPGNTIPRNSSALAPTTASPLLPPSSGAANPVVQMHTWSKGRIEVVDQSQRPAHRPDNGCVLMNGMFCCFRCGGQTKNEPRNITSHTSHQHIKEYETASPMSCQQCGLLFITPRAYHAHRIASCKP
ncbi:hypothetical protein F5Y18DRAFT_444037 [Xylariaceae sp. FL1019]|nr:hypothetical protein F5Y18DRAFT_444037 [Xylariaceae sp. FL1019]